MVVQSMKQSVKYGIFINGLTLKEKNLGVR